MKDLAFRSATELAAGIRSGRYSSSELLETFLRRVREIDGPLNTVVTLDAEGARSEAHAADQAVAQGAPLGPLHGVPMTIKDSFMTAGMRTTSGAPELADFIPEADAVPVARLRRAGAVIFGKTNLPLYAGDLQSYNAVFGRSNNPWDLSRTVGGSSGGAAGALAAGLTPLELGSDIGGSIRNPAAMCGVFGHKPSYGIVPALGQIPGPPGTLTQADIAVAGPMARSVDDLKLALDVLAGADEWQGVAWRLELPPPRHGSLKDFRVAVWSDDAACPVDREIREKLDTLAGALEAAGATVSTRARPTFNLPYAVAVFEKLLGAALAGGYTRDEVEALARAGESEAGPLERNAALRHRAWLSANEQRLQMRKKWAQFFTEWDALLLPVSPSAAILHDDSLPMWRRTFEVNGESRPYHHQFSWVGLTGVAYLPVTVVPAGCTAAGLPVGIQIAGPYLEDHTTMGLAHHLTEILGGFESPSSLVAL